MCLYSKLIDNGKYKPNKKNGGVVPPVFDERVLTVAVGCGKCIECMKQKANTWKVRMMEDIKVNTNGKFVTMTFSDESYKELWEKVFEQHDYKLKGYDADNAIATLAVRRFVERWRKEFKKSVRHWIITELGQNGTENIHLHGIIWTDNKEAIQRHWKYGHVFIGDYVDGSTVSYIVKYMSKADAKHKNYKPKMLTSAGIGKNYITGLSNKARNKFKDEKTKEDYLMPDGTKTSLPIYYRNKLYTDEERETLWLNRLDKKERYVLGQKVDLSDGGTKLAEALKEAKKTNRELGYGGSISNKEQKEQEQKLREINQRKRIKRSDDTQIEEDKKNSKLWNWEENLTYEEWERDFELKMSKYIRK